MTFPRLTAALAALTLAGPAAAQSGGATAAQVQALEEETRHLQGRIEELEHRLKSIAEDAARRINDLEFRVNMLEGGDPSMVGDPVPLGQSQADAGPAVAVSEQVALEEARAALDAGDPGAARDRLSRFLAEHPDSPLAPEAQYWLGVAQWELGEARAAAQTFLANISDHPDGPKAPDSLLMLARALAEIDRPADACGTLKELARRFPDSEATAQADDDRARLGCG